MGGEDQWTGQGAGRTLQMEVGIREGRAVSGTKTCPQRTVSWRAVWADRVEPVPSWKGYQEGQDLMGWRTT